MSYSQFDKRKSHKNVTSFSDLNKIQIRSKLHQFNHYLILAVSMVQIRKMMTGFNQGGI